jgi:hypothetical protein
MDTDVNINELPLPWVLGAAQQQLGLIEFVIETSFCPRSQGKFNHNRLCWCLRRLLGDQISLLLSHRVDKEKQLNSCQKILLEKKEAWEKIKKEKEEH